MSRSSQKALVIPEKLGDFVIQAVAVPNFFPSEVLVRVESIALNPVDWKIQEQGVFVSTYPAILGVDGAGIVEGVGSEVTAFQKGDRV